jgi:hypothetical protein
MAVANQGGRGNEALMSGDDLRFGSIASFDRCPRHVGFAFDSRPIAAAQQTNAMGQERPRVVPQTGGVLAKLDSARYRQLQHQELGRRPAPTCSPSKVAFFLRKKMWPVRQLNGTSHHGVMRSSLRRRGRE